MNLIYIQIYRRLLAIVLTSARLSFTNVTLRRLNCTSTDNKRYSAATLIASDVLDILISTLAPSGIRHTEQKWQQNLELNTVAVISDKN